MATTAPRAAGGARVSETGLPLERAATFSVYLTALKEAGVAEDDLRLLRELAELNALTRQSEAPPPTRILL